MKAIDYKTLTKKHQTTDITLECFDPDGFLEEVLQWGSTENKGDEEVLDLVEAMITTGSLETPWGLKIKDSLLLGDWWIISDSTAKEILPEGTLSFTLDELRPAVEVSRIFEGSSLVRLIRQRNDGDGNA